MAHRNTKPPFMVGIFHGYVSHNQRVSYGFTRTAGMTRDRMRYFLALHALHVLHVLHWRPARAEWKTLWFSGYGWFIRDGLIERETDFLRWSDIDMKMLIDRASRTHRNVSHKLRWNTRDHWFGQIPYPISRNIHVWSVCLCFGHV